MESNELSTNKIKKEPTKKPVEVRVGVVRVSLETADEIEALVIRANGNGPKRVKPKDIVRAAVQKLTAGDLETIREDNLTAQDRFDMGLLEFQKNHPSATKDSFLEHLLTIPKGNN